MRPSTHIIIPVFENDANRSVVPLLNDIERLGTDLAVSVQVFSNNTLLETEARSFLDQHQWEYIRSPQTLPDLQFRRWCYENMLERRGRYFFQIHPYAVLKDRFFEIAVGTWENISRHPKSVLNLTGEGKLPKIRKYVETQQTSAPSHTFLTDKSGIQILTGYAVPPKRTPVWLAKGEVLGEWGTPVYEPTDAALIIPAEPITVTPLAEPKQPVEALKPKPPIPTPLKAKKATFFVATHHRPELLKTCLEHLKQQRVPDGWIYNVLVSGMANDPGMVVAKNEGVQYIVSPSPTVTSKLNLMLEATDAVLVMKADDDDIQPPDRLMAAVNAYRMGAAWSGVGKIYFYDLQRDRVMRWKGQAEWGLVGTSMNYDAAMLRKLGGWPSRVKGEDGALATLIKALKVPFIDTTDQMGALVCCQHDNNLYPRPVVEVTGRASRGGFVIHGEGTLQQSSLPDCIKYLPALKPQPKEVPTYRPPVPDPVVPREVFAYKQIVVGIGICSYNKPEALTRWAQNLFLMVQQADKVGIKLEPVLSTSDPTPPPALIMNIPVLHRTNLGVAWVKNNALRYLFDRQCDYFFLVEDDCNVPDWSFFHKYVQASQAAEVHHMMYGPIVEWENTWKKTGNFKNIGGFQFLEYKRTRDPQSTPGVITFHTRHALDVSGGMDMRFVGRGHGHKEWTDRTLKLLQLRGEHPFDHPLWMLEIPENRDVTFERGPSRGTADKSLINRNKDLLTTISPRPCYDFLWSDIEFPETYGSHDLWSYLNGKYPYSLVEEDNFNYEKGLEGDKKLFHKLGVSHPADPISICISLKNRVGMFEGFIDYMNLSVDNPSLYEIVITDFDSDDCDLHQVLQKSRVPFKIVPSHDKFFSRGKGLHLAALCAQYDLLMFFDIDMAVSSPLYWAWVRRHTSPEKVIFPICYGLHKNAPMGIKGNTKNPIYSNGFWRDEGYGMAAFHRETYLKVGGWDYRIARWGGEDNDLHWHCKQEQGLEIIRRKSIYLFHRWHPETSDYKDPHGDKSQKTLQGSWKDPNTRGVSRPVPSEVLEGYDD